MLRNYEKGQTPPPEIIDRLKTLAASSGRGDLGVALTSDDWKVQHVIHPGETLIASHRPGKYNPRNQALHDMLEEVLESGNKKAIDAVVPNLVVFADYVRQVRGSKTPAKGGNAKRREIG